MTVAEAAPRIAVPPQIEPDALAGHDPSAPVVTLAGATMGTTWRVQAALPAPLASSGDRLRAAIADRLANICAQMSQWEPQSQLSRFNRAPAGSAHRVSADFARVIASALAIAEASGGAFDPALGRLTDLWGLGPRAAARPPGKAELAAARAERSWWQLGFDAEAATLHQPGGVWLDLSGIAKGHAVDAVADLLAAHGVRYALVEIGGELCGRGMRPDGDPWWVELESPPAAHRLPPLRVALHQLSVATSGDYLRGGHTLDPVTGLPITHATTAVSVLHPSCMVADAWATALGVAVPDRARDLARLHGLAARIVSRSGEEWLSPALQTMLA